MKRKFEDYMWEFPIILLLLLLSFVTLYPFWNSLVISFNQGTDTLNGGITFWPRKFTLQNYQFVFQDSDIWQAFFISVLRTIIGTVSSVLMTAGFGYALSKKELIGRKFYMLLAIVTMYFQGGLIPQYLLIRSLHLMNTFWVMIVPMLIVVWNMIIFRTFFQSLPKGLEESAKMDGANYISIFFRIVFPVSGPVFATLSLFTAVTHWNDFFTPAIYITNQKLIPLQTLLVQIINSVEDFSSASGMSNTQADTTLSQITHTSVVMATIMVAILPIVLVYPFLQKYFVKGVMIGSMKE